MRRTRRARWPPLPATGLCPVAGRGERRNDRGGRRIVEQCDKGKQVEKVEGNAASCVCTGTSYASEHIQIDRFGMSKLFGVNPGIT